MKSFNPFTWLLIGLVRFYQLVISPILGPRCRFYPTCSHYTIDALKQHGIFCGSWLAFKRIIRCHPGNPGGVDPVPACGCKSERSDKTKHSTTEKTAENADSEK